MSYNFKKFVKKGARLGNYSISLSPSYSFGFNSGFYNKEGVKNYKKVVLFYDKRQKTVGFQFTRDEDAEGAFTIIHGKTQSTGSVTVRSFIIQNNLYKKNYFGKKTPTKIIDNKIGELFVIQLVQESEALDA